MQKKFFLLLSATSLISTVHAMNEPLNQNQLTALVTIMKKENKTISPDDSYTKRTTRNLQRCCTSPYEFFELGCCNAPSDSTDAKEEALINYIMNQKFTINEETILFPEIPKTVQMLNAFKDDQRQQIKKYLAQRKEGALGEVCCAKCMGACGIFSTLTVCTFGLTSFLSSLCLLPTSMFMCASSEQ